MVKTGRDFGVIGGIIALITGYFILSVGLSLLRFGEFPPPGGAVEPVSTGGIREALVIALGTACLMGGALGIAGGALVCRRPRLAAILMTTAGVFALFSVFGLISGILFAIGGFRALMYSKAPPGTEPEWQDTESLPY